MFLLMLSKNTAATNDTISWKKHPLLFHYSSGLSEQFNSESAVVAHDLLLSGMTSDGESCSNFPHAIWIKAWQISTCCYDTLCLTGSCDTTQVLQSNRAFHKNSSFAPWKTSERIAFCLLEEHLPLVRKGTRRQSYELALHGAHQRVIRFQNMKLFCQRGFTMRTSQKK